MLATRSPREHGTRSDTIDFNASLAILVGPTSGRMGSIQRIITVVWAITPGVKGSKSDRTIELVEGQAMEFPIHVAALDGRVSPCSRPWCSACYSSFRFCLSMSWPLHSGC